MHWYKLILNTVLKMVLGIQLFGEMGGNASAFVGRIKGAVDGEKLCNALCYKNGSASGWSAWKFYSHEIEVFLKSTTFRAAHMTAAHMDKRQNKGC